MPIELNPRINSEWHYGSKSCDVYLFLDQLTTAASKFHMFAITVDRYYAIVESTSYGANRTTKQMITYVSVIWMMSFLVSLPLLIVSNEYSIGGFSTCLLSPNIGYKVYSILVSFYIPYAVTMFFFLQLFRAVNGIKQAEDQSQSYLKHITVIQKDSLWQHKMHIKLYKDYNASIVVGLMLIAFTVCWLPYYILSVVSIFIGYSNVPVWLNFLFIWLGNVHSMLNPIINGFLVQTFRTSIRAILCCRCYTLNFEIRKTMYIRQYGKKMLQLNDAINEVSNPTTTSSI